MPPLTETFDSVQTRDVLPVGLGPPYHQPVLWLDPAQHWETGMDLGRMGRLARVAESGKSRRSALTGLLGGVLCALGVPNFSPQTLTVGATERRRNKRKRERERNKDRSETPASPPPLPVDPVLPDDGADADLNPEEAAFLALLNDYRTSQGIPPLTHNLLLAEAAELHSADMALNNFTGHTGSDGSMSFDR